MINFIIKIPLCLPLFLLAQTNWQTAIFAEDDWSYIMPEQELPLNWKDLNFNDQDWLIGPGGFGYGDGDDGTIITQSNSVFLRKIFMLTDLQNFCKSILHADYDDGFIAYLNGIEISRSQNMGLIGSQVEFNQGTNEIDHEATMYLGQGPEYTILDSMLLSEILIEGENILAIQVNNVQESSSDLSSNFYLSFEVSEGFSYFDPTPDWFTIPIVFEGSNLPIVLIDTYGQNIVDEPRISAFMGIIDNQNGLNNINDSFNDYNGNITIELRGNSSQYNPKKPYRIETVNSIGENLNVSILGMPEENDWVLYAPYQDKTMLRNALAYKLANDMARYAPRTRFCELYINEQYLGVYILMEKIKRDANRVDISKLTPDEVDGDDVTGGYILKFDWYYTGDNIGGFESVYDGMAYNYHYPKPSDITPEQESYISDYINTFEEIMSSDNYTDVNTGYPNLIDINSFIEFILLQEFSKNVDAYRLSTYIYKDKESINNKLTAGPIWDINHGFGNCDYGYTWLTEGWLLDYNPEGGDQMAFWWELLWEDPNFKNKISERYSELRQNILSKDYIFSSIDSMQTHLGLSINRNFQRWDILGTYVWPNYYVFDTYEEEIDYLKSWIDNRLVWMDSQILNLEIIEDKTIPNQISYLYPNPFNSTTKIDINLKNKSDIKIEICGINGKTINTIYETASSPGINSYSWNIRNSKGNSTSTGIYFFKIYVDGIFRDTKKVLFLK